jgi:hypothetical protein
VKTVRVWLNHWFSTAYHIIQMLKDDAETDFVVVGSNTDSNCVYKSVCDEWSIEPKFGNSDAYVDFCLHFCREYSIDVFVPRRNMLAVSRRISEFHSIGIKVLVDDYSLVKLLNDKSETYRLFSENNIGYIPKYAVVDTVYAFQSAYAEMKTDGNRVCFKFASDEGAVSFRVVDDRIKYNLTEPIGAKITYDDAIKSLRDLTSFPPLLIMPYLPGAEISVDCLYMPDGEHIIIPRHKSLGRSESIEFDLKILEICSTFLNKFSLRCPCNLQFKYDGEIPYLLEVNTRMSGGLQLGYTATGVNIPNIAVNRLLGKEVKPLWDKKSTVVSFVETPIVLEEKQ